MSSTIEPSISPTYVTVGELPTAFADSLSYYEAWKDVVKFIENKIVTAINANAEQLQALDDYLHSIDFYEFSKQAVYDLIKAGDIEITLDYNSSTEALTLNLGDTNE